VKNRRALSRPGARGHRNVDDLPVLVDRPVDVSAKIAVVLPNT
jgi:hypothetical protein